MSADDLVERASRGLQGLADRAAAQGGLASRLAGDLREDAAFVRKLKPSLIAARARGRAPTDEHPGARAAPPVPASRPSPPRATRVPDGDGGGGGPSPFAVVGAALAGGMLLAKVVDWRSHAHPRL